jgi:hypothetical protein
MIAQDLDKKTVKQTTVQGYSAGKDISIPEIYPMSR